MTKHRYILEPYKGMNTRYYCPGCQHKDKTFIRYIDTETGEHLNPGVGRCNRENKCGYHCNPKQYFQDNGIKWEFSARYARTCAHAKCLEIKPIQKPVSFIPVEVFKASLKELETNNFVKFLIHFFGVEIASQLISRYFIGTSKYWDGATVFWQIDAQGNIRTGKIMLYSPDTGKRIKEPFNHINWVHKALKMPEFDLSQCFFGEYLIKIESAMPIAIVESEKTAVIASIYLPQFLWLAVGSLTNLSAEKCKVLKGRQVTLFPDLNGFEKWSEKTKELARLFPSTMFNISDLLECKASEAEKHKGLDIADYLIRFDYREFQQQEKQNNNVKTTPLSGNNNGLTMVEPLDNNNKTTIEPENWEQKIIELDHYFKTATLSAIPVKLNPCSTITNVPLFIDSHLNLVKANNGKRFALPYLERLQELKQYLTLNTN